MLSLERLGKSLTLTMTNDDNDPDAIVCMQFEEGLVEALQSDTELASCYNTYLDARKRLTDRNKNRGFWNASKGSQQFSKGKGKGKGKWNGRFRKPLSQRILESECRRYGQKGHWKAECPLNRSAAASATGNSKDAHAFAGTAAVISSSLPEDDMILLDEAAEAVELKMGFTGDKHECFMGIHNHSVDRASELNLSDSVLSRFVSSLKCRLSPLLPRPPEPPFAKTQPVSPCPVEPKSPTVTNRAEAEACFASHGPFGIVDLGASQTVIGQDQLKELWNHIPFHVSKSIRRIPCQTIFRFGNSSTVTCQEALLVPLGKWFIRVCVVKTQTPFLLSNNVFRTLGAQINTATDTVYFSELDLTMPLQLSEKKLYLLDFCELVSRVASRKTTMVSETDLSDRPVMSVESMTEVPGEIPTESQFEASSVESPCPASEPCLPPSSISHGHDISCRSPPGRHQSEEARGVHDKVLRGVVSPANCLRRGQSGDDLFRGDRERPEVCTVVKDPKYAQWFARKYAHSTKETHRSFLFFLNLYVERQELKQGEDHHQVPLTPRPNLDLKAKSRAAPPHCAETGSQDSWSEPDMTWEPYAPPNAQISEEVQMQGQRINNMENMLSQISQQLQMIMQTHPMSASSK